MHQCMLGNQRENVYVSSLLDICIIVARSIVQSFLSVPSSYIHRSHTHTQKKEKKYEVHYGRLMKSS
jgi:hypothetical protein